MPRQPLHPIDSELLQLLGELVTKFAAVESLTSELLAVLTKADPAALQVVTTNVSQNAITSWIRTLLDFVTNPPDWIQATKDAMDEVDELRAERNMLVHGLWYNRGTPHSAIVQTVRLERKEVFRDVVVTASDLKETINDIQKLSVTLVNLLDAN